MLACLLVGNSNHQHIIQNMMLLLAYNQSTMFSIFFTKLQKLQNTQNIKYARLESQYIGHILFLQQSIIYRNERGSISSEIKLTEHISHLEQILINSGKRAKFIWLETKSTRRPKLIRYHLHMFYDFGIPKITW